MRLCQNVYRRGALYWWRRRFVDPAGGQSRMIAISLRIREPTAARLVGMSLNARAYEITSRLRAFMTIEEAQNDLVVIVNAFAWRFSQEAVASLDRLALRPQPPSSPCITREQQIAALRMMAEEARTEILRGAMANQVRAAVDGCGRPLDPLAEARAGEIAQAAIYRTIAQGGRAATLDESLRATLADSVGESITRFVERQVASMAAHEDLDGDRWLLGPPRSYFVDRLRSVGCAANLDEIRLVRRDYLLICAALLEDQGHRSRLPVADEVLNALKATEISTPQLITPETSTSKEIPDQFIDSSYRDRLLQQAIPQPPARLAPKSLTQHVEDLIKTKRRPVDKHGREIPGCEGWDNKTMNQHRSIARMVVKLAGTDEPKMMDQSVLGAYRLLLEDLPKNWGKSPADAARSIDEIVARAQDLEEHEVGLMGSTIDRHMTQLSNIIAYVAAQGVRIGEITPKMRPGGSSRKRGVFTLSELKLLFESSVWTGCASAADRLTSGSVIIKDAFYWVVILGRYELLRLSEATGLLTTDIDFAKPAVLVRDNEERRLKTPGATRRQPLVAEVLRLGFLEYAAAMRDAGHRFLFPCLRQRGDRTPLSNLFYKDLKKLLDCVLPNAVEERKSFHSLRKDGNTIMANGNINDPIRHAVMGHAHSGVNEKYYLDAVYDEAKLLALNLIPIVTAHL